MRLARFSRLMFPLLLLLSGCASVGSILAPYQGNFMCEDTEDVGRCLNVTDAYEEAVDGVSNREQTNGTNGTHEAARDAYKESEYREMKKLIDKPVTPLVKPPKVLRTLVTAYPSGNDTLFSPRYIWYFVDAGNFVLGDALSQNFESAGSLLTPFAVNAGNFVE